MKALKYKVRIKPEGESKKHLMPVRQASDRTKGYGAFFPIDDVEKDSSFYNDIWIEFISMSQELLQLICDVFPIFLSATSFGFFINAEPSKFFTIFGTMWYKVMKNLYIFAVSKF